MQHDCGEACDCRKDLDGALAALERSTTVLRSFIFQDSPELIEKRVAQVRAAHINLMGAMAAYRDHLTEDA